ncbi:hypothetical protein BH11BAC2_BH11BAC2_13980 [soil metagenome]
MEVHHHAHSHGKKGWKAYGWEFLMLFLAVFCGFLAEYKLEHIIEHQREKKYMQLMVEDLKLDTAEFSAKIMEINERLIPWDKSSTNLLFGNIENDSLVRELYIAVPQSLFTFQVTFQDGTAIQLRNSGNLRLIENSDVSINLSKYWSHCNLITQLLSSYNSTRMESKEMYFSLFNLHYYEENYAFAPIREGSKLELLSKDRVQYIILGNKISNLNSQLTGPFLVHFKSAHDEAANLIQSIQTEYHLK